MHPQAAERLFSSLPAGTEKVVVESRPQYVTAETLARMTPLVPRLEVALGLESASDRVLHRCVHKGFTFADYTRAVQAARDAGAGVRTYLLLKPPFMTELAAVEDARSSLEAVALFSDHVSLNLATVQRGTYVEYLWQRWGYRPPWLWSAVDLARWWAEDGPGAGEGSGVAEGHDVKVTKGRDAYRVPLTLDPVGAGSPRGPHNCGRCDRQVAAALRRFSLSQDAHEFDALRCGCRGLYKKYMELEEVAFGATLLR